MLTAHYGPTILFLSLTTPIAFSINMHTTEKANAATFGHVIVSKVKRFEAANGRKNFRDTATKAAKTLAGHKKPWR